MVYCGTSYEENIFIHHDGEPTDIHYITMSKSPFESKFVVTCCCYEDWIYEFSMKTPSDYDRVKFNIMETMFECDSVDMLIAELSEIFEDGFSDILITEETEEVELDKNLN